MKLATSLESIQGAIRACLKCNGCTYGTWPANETICPLFARDECFTYSAGGLLKWDVWDGNLTRGKVREAHANLESAREEQRKLRLALDLEVEQARLDLNAARERLGVTEQAVAQATESASLTRSRFQQGAALSTQLMDAETALVSARVRRAEAAADQRIALAALRKALGLPQLDSKPATESK